MQTTETTHNPGEVMQLESEHVLQTYRRAPVVFERGSGCRLFDAAGRGYLDFISGIGVSSLGPRASAPDRRDRGPGAASCSTPRTCIFHPLQGEVAAKLAELSGLPRAFFCNSGTEAVEACSSSRAATGTRKGTPRTAVVALQHAFHGRTMGALSVTWDEHYRAPFSPLLDGVTFVSNDGSGGAAGGGDGRRPRRSSPSRCRAKAASAR